MSESKELQVAGSNLTIRDLREMGEAVAKSGLFGIKTCDQAVALMLIAQAEGMSPALAARDYHVIQGRPALKADAMLSRFQAASGKVEWHDYTDDKVSATFSHPSGGKVRVEWTIDMAKRIGLTGKDNWRHYPRAMLRARVISEGVRTCFPACCVGVYTPEEVADFDVTPERKPREKKSETVIEDAKVVEEAAPQNPTPKSVTAAASSEGSASSNGSEQPAPFAGAKPPVTTESPKPTPASDGTAGSALSEIENIRALVKVVWNPKTMKEALSPLIRMIGRTIRSLADLNASERKQLLEFLPVLADCPPEDRDNLIESYCQKEAA